MTREISTEFLKSHIDQTPPPVIIDVRLAEDYEIEHLPGAVNNCVFEVAFLERMQDIASKEQRIVVYGDGATSRESSLAADKLDRAGYGLVEDYRGGISSWRSADEPVELSAAAPTAVRPADGAWTIDAEASAIRWTGRNFLKLHTGTMGIREGRVELADGHLRSGRVVMDPTRLVCTDLAGSEWHDVLIRHLCSDDFLDVERFADIVVEFRGATPIETATPGARNARVQATLTLRGQTHPVECTAMLGFDDQARWGLQANLTIDRTRWGMIYGSGRFFQRLGPHLVNDEIDVDVTLVAIQ